MQQIYRQCFRNPDDAPTISLSHQNAYNSEAQGSSVLPAR